MRTQLRIADCGLRIWVAAFVGLSFTFGCAAPPTPAPRIERRQAPVSNPRSATRAPQSSPPLLAQAPANDPFGGDDDGDLADDLKKAGEKLKARSHLGEKGYVLAHMSDEEEAEIGRALAGRFAARDLLAKDPAITAYVSMVGAIVAENSNRPEIPYRFEVLDTMDANAFACPGGYIFVTKGALWAMGDEAELAGVLAHEVAHVALRHAVKELDGMGDRLAKKAALVEMDRTMEKYYGPLDPETRRLIGEMEAISDECWTLLTQGRGQGYEFEADAAGVSYAARAGYDPRGMADFLERLKEPLVANPALAKGFASHPPAAERLARVREILKKLPAEGTRQAERFRTRAILPLRKP